MRIRTAAVGAVAAAAVAVTAAPAGAATAAVQYGARRLGTTVTAAKPNVAPNAAVGFTISNVQCFANAITFTARTSESGRSGVQQFKQTAREQEFTNAGWQNITGTAVTRSSRFPNDFRNFYYSFNWRATHPANGASYRVIWQGFYLNGFGQALYKTRPIAVNCL